MSVQVARKPVRITIALLSLLLSSCVAHDSHEDAIAKAAISCVRSHDAGCASKLFHIPEAYSASKAGVERELIAAMLAVAYEELGPVHDVQPSQARPVLQVGIGSGDFPYWNRHPYTKTYVYDVRFQRANEGQIWILVTTVAKMPELREIKFSLPRTSPGAASIIENLAKREFEVMESFRQNKQPG